MRRNFTEYIDIYVSRKNNDDITLTITSDYSGSERKSALYVIERGLVNDVETLWKDRKGTKLKGITLSFDEIDWYDDEVDVYTTPIISIGKGLRKAKVGEQTHGSIPKEWGIDLTFSFSDTKVVTPLLDAIKSSLGYKFTTEMQKSFKKDVKGFMQKKERSYSIGLAC